MLFDIIIIVAIIAAILLGLVVLVQNPKGGGLSGSFGGAANQIFGYKRSTDDIERITWGLVIIVFALCLSTAAIKPGVETQQPGTNLLVPEAKQPSSTMTMPAQTTDEGATQEVPATNSDASQQEPDK